MYIRTCKNIIWVFLLAFLTASCSESLEQVWQEENVSRQVKTRLSNFQSNGWVSSLEGENNINDMQACVFENGILTQVYKDLKHTDNVCNLKLDKMSGMLYMLANTGSWLDLDALKAQGITEKEWLEQTVDQQNGKSVHFFTSKTDLSAYAGQYEIPVELKRGVARFDLLLRAGGLITVNGVTLKNLAQKGFLVPREEVVSPSDVVREDWNVTFDAPLQTDSLGLVYVYEQTGKNLAVDVEVMIGQKKEHLVASLPQTLKRNAVYTLTVRKDAVSADLELVVEEWENGGDYDLDSDLDTKLKIDVPHSQLPSDAYFEDGVLVLSSSAADLTLSVNCDYELELASVSGFSQNLEIEELPAEDGSWNGNHRFLVRKPLIAPGHETEDVTLYFRRKGMSEVYEEDCLKFRFMKNPIRLEGDWNFDGEDYTCDFKAYVENELGRMILPEGLELVADFDEGEDAWVKVEQDTNNVQTYRVIGGWKPNDPKADGREQKAALVVRRIADGKETERYFVKRRNFGLPVVWLNGIWWCKYNAIGNSRDFNEQILCSEDPARLAQKSVLDYLKTCSETEFLTLWNSAYMGKSGEALTVSHQDSGFGMSGWYDEKQHINNIDTKELAPTGYEMPTFREWKNLFRGRINITEEGTVYMPENFPNDNAYKVRIAYTSRTGIKLDGVDLPEQKIVSLSPANDEQAESLVFYGAGSQGKNGIQFDLLQIAGRWTDGGSIWGWILDYNQKVQLTTSNSGANFTRMLRFKKSFVEYIYGIDTTNK